MHLDACCVFFFEQETAYELRISDWSSDVCSSDLDKPAQRPKPGSVVDVVGVDGTWIGRGFYNGHSRIALRMLEADPDVAVDAAWFAHRIGEAVRLRREVLDLDAVSDAWRVVHSEG